MVIFLVFFNPIAYLQSLGELPEIECLVLLPSNFNPIIYTYSVASVLLLPGTPINNIG